MGSCCCSSSSDQRKAAVSQYSDIPELHPAVYVDLAIPKDLVPSSSTRSSNPLEISLGDGEEATIIRETATIDYDKIMTDFNVGCGILIQLSVRQQDTVFFKRMSDSGQDPKPVIVATVTDPEDHDGKWLYDVIRNTLYHALLEQFNEKEYQIIIIPGDNYKE